MGFKSVLFLSSKRMHLNAFNFFEIMQKSETTEAAYKNRRTIRTSAV